VSAPATAAERLAAALAVLARDLPNPWDESTDYFHAFSIALPAATRLDAASFKKALAIGARYQVELAPARDMLDALAAAGADWGEEIAAGWGLVAKVMGATLGGLSLAFVRGRGVVRVRVFLFGRDASGALVGLRSTSTET
jgi:hypothetical protein